MKLSNHTALGIGALENGERFTAEIVKTYWTRTKNNKPNFHVQLRGKCRGGQSVNLFHKLYRTSSSERYSLEWLKPFGVTAMEDLEDGDLVGHHISGKIVYRGIFHVVEVLSIDQRPPINASWHDKFASNVTAWRYSVQPPEGVYRVKVEAVEALHPHDNRMRIGTRLICRIDSGSYEGNKVVLDLFEKPGWDGVRYPTEPMASLLEVLCLQEPEHLRQASLVGRCFAVNIWWPENVDSVNVSIQNKFLKLLEDGEELTEQVRSHLANRQLQPRLTGSSQV